MILSNIQSIKNRIIAIILLICVMTIGTAITIVTIMDISRIKKNIADQASIAAGLVGQSCVSALTFNYPDTAEKNLKMLQSFPGIINAWIFDAKGSLFATYGKKEAIDPVFSESPEEPFHYKGEYLYIGAPILYENKSYGVIYLKISPEIKQEIYSRITIATLLAAILLFVAYLLANFAQKIVSDPILLLAETAEKVSDEADYSIRLENKNKGEVGILYDSFNGMLGTIKAREKERDMAEKNLLFKEQVIESSTGAVATADFEGVVTYSNPAFMKLFGYIEITNVVGRPFSVFLENEEAFEFMLTSLSRQRAWTREINARQKDGSLFNAIISADTILDEKGRADSFVITVSDITELRKTTLEMERENLLKTALQAISDRLRGVQKITGLATGLLTGLSEFIDFQVGAVYILDEAGVLSLKGGYALLETGEFIDEFELGQSLVGQAAMEKKTLHISDIPRDYFRISSGSGQSSPRYLLAVPFIYNGDVKGVLEIGSFNAFRQMNFELLDRLNETVGIAINTSQANEKLHMLLEKTQMQSEKLLTQTEELQSQQEELQQTNEELEEQAQILEEQQADIRKKNLELEKTGLLVEQKARDLEITSRYKSEFMANMSHELRTPLNSILLLSDVLTENKNGNLSEKQIEFIRNIHESGSDLLVLINDILDLSKIESGQMELVLEDTPVSEFESIAQRVFEPLAKKKNLSFTIHIDKTLPKEIMTDKQKAEQVLKNLISNAFKFTSQGGVTLAIARPKPGEKDFPKNFDPEKTIAFQVSDTGIGIPKEKFAIVFEAFKQVDGTTSRKYGGTGLGLSISREIAQYLGGAITLSSEPGKGSVFTFYLPYVLEEPVLSKSKKSPGIKTAGIKGILPGKVSIPAIIDIDTGVIKDDRDTLACEDRSVLIIEDDPGFARILCDLAREQDFKVIVASDGEAGLHFADFYRPSAIILDLGLPGIDGWAVMERLKKNLKTRHIPIHIISAEEIRRKALNMGAVGFLTKPVSLEKLETVFKKFTYILSRPVRKALVVEDDEEQCKSIQKIIGNGDVKVFCTHSISEAEDLLSKKEFDCLILDLNLPDQSGVELLSFIKQDQNLNAIPIIVYTGKPLTNEEVAILHDYARSITVKGVDSPERLLDETTLFLHRVEANLSEPNRKVLRQIYEKESRLKGKRILLVDDDMRNVFAINNILEEKGLKIIVCKNGMEAVNHMKTDSRIDLVLMDMMMPEMDGYQAMQEIRKQKKFERLPIIALTAKAMKGDRAKCIEAGANDYLSKPIEKEKLFSMIRVWLY